MCILLRIQLFLLSSVIPALLLLSSSLLVRRHLAVRVWCSGRCARRGLLGRGDCRSTGVDVGNVDVVASAERDQEEQVGCEVGIGRAARRRVSTADSMRPAETTGMGSTQRERKSVDAL